MRATDEELLAGALTLAYAYAGVGALRRAYAAAEAAGNGLDVVGALEREGALSPARADKLRRGAEVVQQLRTDAVYGMICLRNRLVGGQMLNACMEEAKRGGYRKPLSELLVERGLVTREQNEAIVARREEVLPDLLERQRGLAQVIDLEADGAEATELKLATLLGEVAAKVSFLQKDDLDLALRARRRIDQGLPAEEPEPEPAPAPEPEVPLPPLSEPGTGDGAAAGGGDGAAAAGAAEGAPAGAAGGGSAAAPAEEEDPIKGYELLLKLGQGAMGAVLKARKRDTGEHVALKILKPELANDREYVERFLREAKAVARMGHPNIIRAIQAGRSGEYYFFAMEFVEGQTVSELLKAKGRLPERFALMVIRCIAGALAHAWQHQIVHRDIKPDNIMITQDGAVKLTDLGLARSARQDSTLTITGVVMGSPAYISPEQATGEKNLDARSDIYSLGAALYHMLAGRVPYEGETPLHVMLKHMNDPVPPLPESASVCRATRELLETMMAKRPEQRFQRPQEVEAAARAIEDALARGQRPASLTGRSPQPERVSAFAETQMDESDAAPPKLKAPKRASLSGEPKGPSGRRAGKPGKGKGGGTKDVGERLRRMASRRKRRF